MEHGENTKNVIDYVENKDNKAWKDIWITMTINSKKNYKTIKTVIDDWKEYTNKIGFQFHIPFMEGDPLWLPFGKERDKVIDELLDLKSNEYKEYIVNPKHRLEIMKTRWGEKGTNPIDWSTWEILSVNHKGEEKRPCCIESSDNDSMKPRCEECGLWMLLSFVRLWNQRIESRRRVFFLITFYLTLRFSRQTINLKFEKGGF